jgi:hypothetical protein
MPLSSFVAGAYTRITEILPHTICIHLEEGRWKCKTMFLEPALPMQSAGFHAQRSHKQMIFNMMSLSVKKQKCKLKILIVQTGESSLTVFKAWAPDKSCHICAFFAARKD